MLICPPAMRTAFLHCEPGTSLDVDGHNMPYELISGHAVLFNYTGHPALALPYGQDRDGLPIGIQVVGKRWDEARLLAIGRALAEITGRFRPPGLNALI